MINKMNKILAEIDIALDEATWDGASDSRSPNYGMLFDTGPHDTYAETLAAFARRADRLIAWREASR